MADINVLYKYRFLELYLIYNQEVLKLDWTNVESLRIYKDYDENIRPEYILTLRVDNKVNMWMSRHQNDFQVYLDIQKVITDNDGNMIGPSTTFIKSTFLAFNQTSSSLSIDRLQNTDGSILNSTDVNDLSEMMVGTTISLGLMQMEMFNKSMSPANCVIKKDNMQNIVLSILTRAGFKKVLMSPFQNYTVYEDLIIPPLPTYRAIQYLDGKYGFYKTGSVIFYDYDTVYILDSSMKYLVYPRNDDPFSTLNIFESTKQMINGHVSGTKSRQLYVANSTTNIVYGEDIHNTVGSTTIIADSITGEKSEVTYQSENFNKIEAAQVFYSNSDHIDFVRQRQIENKVRLSFSGYHYDIDTFRPNILTSIYHSNSDIQKRVKGKYRTTAVMSEIMNTGDNFTALVSASYAYCRP